MIPAREEILKRLEQAVKGKKIPDEPDLNTPVFKESGLPLVTAFKNNLQGVSGSFCSFTDESELFLSIRNLISDRNWSSVYCLEPEIQNQLIENNIAWKSDPDFSQKVDACITGCEFLVAQTGSAMVSSAQKTGRKMFAFPDAHILIAHIGQLVETLNEAYKKLTEKYRNNLPSQVTLITGPSRTADIEKTLVLGAHGPRELFVYLFNPENA